MKKVLVTGATGFIGNHVVEALLAKGYIVVATSSNKDKAVKKKWFSGVEYVPFDLHNYEPSCDYFKLFKSPDILIHLAWEGLPNYKSLFHFEENLPAHYLFIKNMVQNGLSDVNVAGTCFEYGMQQGCLKESQIAVPVNPYALAKDTLRKFLVELKNVNAFSFKWLRLFYMYGKGQHQNSLFSQLDTALDMGSAEFNMSGGEQVRDYLAVEIAAQNLIAISLQSKVDGIINCCSGNPVTVKELIKNYLVKREKNIILKLGYYAYPDYEPMKFWGDVSKLKSIVNND